MDLFSIIILGLVQGVTEWVPVSSKTQVSLVYFRLLSGNPEYIIPVLLFVHLGTLFAATIYFRRQLREIFAEIASKPYSMETYTTGRNGFLVTSLLLTGLVGLPILYAEKKFFPALNGQALYVVMGAGLIFTSLLLFTSQKRKLRTQKGVKAADGILTGIMQGLSTLPGVSRAGTTSTALIWRGFDSDSAFNLSFLLSIPSVAATEVVFYLGSATGHLPLADGLLLALSSFIFGYVTLDLILRAVKKVNLAYLTLILGIIVILSAVLNAA